MSSLSAHRIATHGIVTTAARMSWKRARAVSAIPELPSLNRADQHSELPLDLNELHAYTCNRAMRHIRVSKKGENILTICVLECLESPWPLKLYLLRRHWATVCTPHLSQLTTHISYTTQGNLFPQTCVSTTIRSYFCFELYELMYDGVCMCMYRCCCCRSRWRFI